MIIGQYEKGLAFYRREIESKRYEIGRAGRKIGGRSMTAGVNPHIQALRDALVAEHEEHIAEIQRRADDAAARGEEWYHRWYLRQVDDLKAMPYPWDEDEVA